MASFIAAPANFTNSSDANFRAWGSYLAARFAAVGLIKTADTGQIDWTTVLTPSGVNTYTGYEIWRFADALQATAPVYFKIEYGEGAVADGPGVRFQFGSGSNGTGTLTGTLSSLYVNSCQTQAAATVIVGSGGTARFVFAGGFPTTGTVIASAKGMCFSFERSKNSDGTDNAEAVLFTANGTAGQTSAGSAHLIAIWSTTLGSLTLETTYNVMFPAGATMTLGTQTMICPIFHNKGVYMNPGMNCIGAYIENIVAHSTPAIYMYGIARTYYMLPEHAWASGNSFRCVGTGTESIAIRYE